MIKFLRSFALVVVGAVFGALGIAGIASWAAPVALFTGPAGTNPVVGIPATLPDLNALINNINAAISPTGLFSSSTFQLGGSISVGSLTLGLVAPQSPNGLLSNTAQGFITFSDSQGRNTYIPFWR